MREATTIWQRPTSLAEFIERWPSYVKNFCANSFVPPQQREDMEQELLLKLCAGQAIEKYDPGKRGGADTPGQFFNYVVTVLKRAQQTIMARRLRDAMRHLQETPKDRSWAEYAEDNSRRVRQSPCQDYSAMAQQVLGRLAEACPAYAYTLGLLASGASLKDISEATGVTVGTLRNIVQAVVPAVLIGEKPRRSQSYRRLEALGEYAIAPALPEI